MASGLEAQLPSVDRYVDQTTAQVPISRYATLLLRCDRRSCLQTLCCKVLTDVRDQDRHLRLFLKTISTAEFLPDNTTDLELKKIAFPVDLEQLYHNLSMCVHMRMSMEIVVLTAKPQLHGCRIQAC